MLATAINCSFATYFIYAETKRQPNPIETFEILIIVNYC